MKHPDLEEVLLSGIAPHLIHAAYGNAPGNELVSGKFFSPESSSALAANAFGLFLDRPADLPPLVGCEGLQWPARSVQLEAIVRFPWSGGHHPCLDALVETEDALIGVESKRYEPFRSKKEANFSEAYWRPVWGEDMRRYEDLRDRLRARDVAFSMLDAAQLIKHAFGLRTAVHRDDKRGKRPVLFYLYAEPARWPDEQPIDATQHASHRAEIEHFASLVEGDEVSFRFASYRELLSTWARNEAEHVRNHATAVAERFQILEGETRSE